MTVIISTSINDEKPCQSHASTNGTTLSAQVMATDNLVSAMEMKTPAVKHTHINMVLQQTQIGDLYNQLIREMGWKQPPMTSAQEQLNMIQQFNILFR